MLNQNQEYEKRIQELEEELNSAKFAVEELKILNDIAISSGRATDVDQTLNIVLYRTIKAVNAEQGAILLISENHKDILKTFIRRDDTSNIKENYRISSNITGWILFNKMSLLIKDLSTDERFKSTVKERENIKSLICSPIWFEGKVIGILQMVNKKSAQSFTENDLTLLSIISVQAGQLIKNSEMQQLNFQRIKETENATLRAEKAELQTKEIEAEKEIEKEKIRTRIAADLHDEIATNLSSIATFSKIIIEEENKVDKNDKLKFQLLDRINIVSEESVNSIRDIIWAIDPNPETFYDLLLRIRDTYTPICWANKIELSLPLLEKLPSINLLPEQRKNIWFLIKEALNNSVKHSFCTNLSLSFLNNDNNINIEIADNGKGFNPNLEHKGKGLGTMRKRATLLNGEIDFESNEKGTKITLNFKL